MPANAKPYLVDLAKKLRQKQTKAEEVLWERLRKSKMGGFKFRRQHPFYRYVFDFYCDQAKLAIELEGSIHYEKEVQRNDVVRRRMIEDQGITVLIIRNDEIYDDLENVLGRIEEALEKAFGGKPSI